MDNTEPAFFKALIDFNARLAVLESRQAAQERMLKEYGDRVAALQTTLDKINGRMVFVDRLEAMDGSLTMLVKMAKATIATAATAGALWVAFTAKDATLMKELIGALL